MPLYSHFSRKIQNSFGLIHTLLLSITWKNMSVMMLNFNSLILANLFSLKLMRQREELVLQCCKVIQQYRTHLHVKFQTIFDQFHMPVRLFQRQNQTTPILSVNFLVLRLQQFTSNILHMADLLLLFQITSHLYLCSRNHWPILHPGYQECCCKS